MSMSNNKPITSKSSPTKRKKVGEEDDSSLLEDEDMEDAQDITFRADSAPFKKDTLLQLHHHLGIDEMSSKIDKLTQLIERSSSIPDSGQDPKRALKDFDPSNPLVDSSSDNSDSEDPEESEFPPSICDVNETKGPKVLDFLAKRVNESFTSKPIEDKMKPLVDKYRTPENCGLLCVPRVNTPLWNELSHKAKSADLGLQEVQKSVVKTAQVLVSLTETVIQAKKKKELLNPKDLLSPLSDAISFIGNAGYQTSLKRRDHLKPQLSKGYKSLCASSTPISELLFGDDLSKNVDDISKANRIVVVYFYLNRVNHSVITINVLLSTGALNKILKVTKREKYKPTDNMKYTHACTHIQINNA